MLFIGIELIGDIKDIKYN